MGDGGEVVAEVVAFLGEEGCPVEGTAVELGVDGAVGDDVVGDDVLAAAADEVLFMVAGLPLALKSAPPSSGRP